MSIATILLLAFFSPLTFAQNTCADGFAKITALRPADFYYRVVGPPDAPPLVLLHGLGSNSATFEKILPALSRKYKVIYYDLRGHGRTAQSGSDYSLDVMAKDLAALLDHLEIADVHLLGLSFGARVGMQFGYRYPERVRSLLVSDMDMVARPVDYEAEYRDKAALSENLPRYFSSKEAAYDALRVFYTPEEVLQALDSLVNRSDGTVELLHRPHGMFLFDLGGNGADLAEPLRRFAKPLLFLRADPRKTFLTDEGVRQIQTERPDVPIMTVPNAEHSIHKSHTEEFLKLAERFFDSAEQDR